METQEAVNASLFSVYPCLYTCALTLLRFIAVKRPPMITTQPESVTVFSFEDLVMSCEASGNPPPIFRWTKDGEEFDPGTDPELKVTERSGSFVFYTLSYTMDTLKQYQGTYVCFASNELGTAVSNEAVLSIDVPPIQQKEKRVYVKAEEGSSIVLKCNPPQSSMEPIIHWMDQRLLHIKLSERVVAGKDGNLYFAHLLTNDSRDDYTCNVQYLATRNILVKEPITLTVNPSNSVVRNRRPQMMRPTGSHSTFHTLRGQSLELECIVQGLPTPKVKWIRKDGELSESRTTIEMHNRRLRFSNISASDGGEYQCIAENTQGKVAHTYTVTVEAGPYWIKEPLSQLYAPGESVRLDCQADGIPTPTITWTINGIPISETDKDPRRSLSASGSLILNDVNFGDTAIYQCRASNKHGTIITNTNVFVIELPPQILTEDGNMYTFTEGQKASLECETFGSPKPKVIWESSGTSSLLADPRVNVLISGKLEITNVTHDDEGIYTCSVENTNITVSAELEVLNRTLILTPPQALKVQPGHTAIFTCLASVDPKLGAPFIQWRKNDQKIMESHIDENRSITLSWTPGDDHNSPVLEYVVEFEDQGSKDRGWEELKRVGGNKESVRLTLWPYISYRFRIIAINDVGKSNPSKPSEIHNTPAEAPDNNPEDVRSDSADPDALVITWEEMDKRNFNGPDFKYRVLWRRVLGSGPNWHINYTMASPFTVHDIGNFSAFEIKVQAVNAEGEGPEPDPVIGYSGEDVPLEAPMGVGLTIVNSTAIRVTWAAVDKDTVRGHLLGYKVLILYLLAYSASLGKGCRVLFSFKVVKDRASFILDDLAFMYCTCVTLFCSPFFTASGVPDAFPGPPMSLILDSPSETSMTLYWTAPERPNGVLMGYLLQYQILGSDDSPMMVETIDDPTITHLTLKGLDQNSHYRFYLRGRTATGDGEPIIRDGATTLDEAPPANISYSVGETSVNFSWVPKKRHRQFNFQIHYFNKNDGRKWKKTEKVNSSLSTYQLQDLTPGSHYQLLFTYSNSSSFWEGDIYTEGTGMKTPHFPTQGWFIGVVSAIALLLLILLILCFIKRSKGGKYSELFKCSELD
uniref:L1 cell adhesion molecule, paralog a n=1 Tax=Sphaeramia orbicularis TaxID=375764 RepID=A0A672Z044_9TELE